MPDTPTPTRPSVMTMADYHLLNEINRRLVNDWVKDHDVATADEMYFDGDAVSARVVTEFVRNERGEVPRETVIVHVTRPFPLRSWAKAVEA